MSGVPLEQDNALSIALVENASRISYGTRGNERQHKYGSANMRARTIGHIGGERAILGRV